MGHDWEGNVGRVSVVMKFTNNRDLIKAGWLDTAGTGPPSFRIRNRGYGCRHVRNLASDGGQARASVQQ